MIKTITLILQGIILLVCGTISIRKAGAPPQPTGRKLAKREREQHEKRARSDKRASIGMLLVGGAELIYAPIGMIWQTTVLDPFILVVALIGIVLLFLGRTGRS
ncbi:MAG: hypothetical protein Q4D31_00200 [Eubacteriales bacterium]|nr:hypothetical protein [Eubacteriales bacterium]